MVYFYCTYIAKVLEHNTLNSTKINILGLGTDVEFSVGSGGTFIESSSETTTRQTTSTTKVGFTIADSTPGDQLAVEIFADPVYGTPMVCVIDIIFCVY